MPFFNHRRIGNQTPNIYSKAGFCQWLETLEIEKIVPQHLAKIPGMKRMSKPLLAIEILTTCRNLSSEEFGKEHSI
jgi:hypothetical protein